MNLRELACEIHGVEIPENWQIVKTDRILLAVADFLGIQSPGSAGTWDIDTDLARFVRLVWTIVEDSPPYNSANHAAPSMRDLVSLAHVAYGEAAGDWLVIGFYSDRPPASAWVRDDSLADAFAWNPNPTVTAYRIVRIP